MNPNCNPHLNIVSDKTVIRRICLELGMDMEADLGIDSIKEFEILGAMLGAIPAASNDRS